MGRRLFLELSHLLQTDVVRHVAVKVIQDDRPAYLLSTICDLLFAERGLLAMLYEPPRGQPVKAFKHSRKMESISKLELRRHLFYQHSAID